MNSRWFKRNETLIYSGVFHAIVLGIGQAFGHFWIAFFLLLAWWVFWFLFIFFGVAFILTMVGGWDDFFDDIFFGKK